MPLQLESTNTTSLQIGFIQLITILASGWLNTINKSFINPYHYVIFVHSYRGGAVQACLYPKHIYFLICSYKEGHCPSINEHRMGLIKEQQSQS